MDSLKSVLSSQRLPLLTTLCAVVLALPSVWTGWQQDDLVHRYFLLGNPDHTGRVPSPLDMFDFMSGDTLRAQALMNKGVVPWWTLPAIRISFWRPITALSHWLDYVLWPDNSALMHLQSLFWFGALAAAAAFLYRRLLGPAWVAGLAALFFALDDAHGLAAGWIANRNALLAALFGFLALMAHDRWRRGAWRGGAVASPVLFALALLSGESALAVSAYFLAYALFIDPAEKRRSLAALIPSVVVAAFWLVAWSMRGHGTWGSSFYVDPFSEPVQFLKAVAWKAPILLADQWLLPPSSVVLFLSGAAVTGMWVWAMVVLAAVTLLVLPLLRADRTARFWLTGMVLSILPVCSTMPHSRLLMYAGLGAFGLLAQWIGGLTGRAGWVPAAAWWRGIARVAAPVFLVVHIAIAAFLLPPNSMSAAFAQPYIQDATEKVAAGAELSGQDLVILNHPIVFYGHVFSTARVLAGQSVPRRVRILAPGDLPLLVRRPAANMLLIRPEGGYMRMAFDDVFRGMSHPLEKGERVVLAGMTAEVRDLTPDGRPAEASFEFPVPLEDASLRWLRWEGSGYVPYRPPAVGDSVRLPGTPLPF